MRSYFLAAVFALALAACRDGDGSAESPRVPGPRPQGVSGFFDPQQGETWTYRVARYLPKHAQLSAADRRRHTSLSRDGYRLEFERKRICAGLLRPEGADEEFTCIDIFEDGKKKERELYDVSPEGMFGRGWAHTDGDESQIQLTEPVPIAVPRMAAGESWEAESSDDNRTFLFRVIERTAVTVPAGTFETARIQITSEADGGYLEHTIWFAENVGIVKEESVRSSHETILVRESSELIEWQLPAGS